MKIITVISCFSKCSIAEIWQDSEYVSGSGYLRVLNSPEFWIWLWFWMLRSFGYTRVLNMPLILNMVGFWIDQGYTGFRIRLKSFWICLNTPDYVWICLNMPEYAGICINMRKSAWMACVLHFPISPFVSQSLVYLNT